nr:MAG TPA: hypothetical protein [Bacteriophage sp.]
MKSSTVKTISIIVLALSLIAGIIMIATVLLASTGATILFGGVALFILLRVIAAILEHLEAIRAAAETYINAYTWQCVACSHVNALSADRCAKCGAVKH